MKMSYKKLIALFICLLLTMVLIVGCGSTESDTSGKEKITLRISGGQPESAPMIEYISEYFCGEVAKQVSENTDYEIEWMKGWAGSMVKLGEALEGVETGIVDIGVTVIPLEPAKLKIWNMFYYMPFASYDSTVGGPIIMDMLEKYPELTEVFDDHNSMFIGVGHTEPYGMFSSYEITSVKDLDGEKVGAAGANLTWVEGSGAASVQSALPEMYTSIQTGVYKVGIQPASMAINVQAHEVAPYIVDGFSSIPCDLLIMNKDSFESLPTEVQEIIVSVGKSYTATEPQFVMDSYEACRERAVEEGATVHSLTQEEKVEWANAIPNSVGKIVAELEEMGYPAAEMADYYYSELEKAGVDQAKIWEY
ncbi:MAG: C4-dicarboxylate TRAP transporter substrate-binding protein [Eubacteriales bacterium]